MKLRAFACAALLVLLAVVSAVAVGPFTVNGRDLSDLSVTELYDLSDSIRSALHDAHKNTASTTEDGDTFAVYVINTHSGKFHYVFCDSALQAAPENRAFVCSTPSELAADGYAPCGMCKPGPVD